MCVRACVRLLQTSLEVKEDLQNAQLLVIKNPRWGISLIDISDDNGSSGDVLDSLVLQKSFLIVSYFFISISFNVYRLKKKVSLYFRVNYSLLV